MTDYTFQSKCPITNKAGNVVFNFTTPLAGGFLKSFTDIQNEKVYPLTLSFYDESSLLMVNERIPANVLFNNYFYKSGVSKKLINHFTNLSKIIKKDINPMKILEIGCNDFTLLKLLKSNQTRILGVDPSDVSKQNCDKEDELINDFFTFDISNKIKSNEGLFDLIISTNSFAHINDILDVAKGVENLLSNNGVFLIEVHWLKSLIDNFQFPFIYHEHIYYYTVKSISSLLNKVGLKVFKIDKIDIHGGSIRVYSCKDSREVDESVHQALAEEEFSGATSLIGIKNFFSRLESLKEAILQKLIFYKNKNRRIIGYGASGQSTTLLNYLGLDSSIISFLVDDSPLKIGCLSPGTHLEIKSKNFIDVKSDIILVLAYTFFDEIRSRIGDANYIIPLPTIKEYINDIQ